MYSYILSVYPRLYNSLIFLGWWVHYVCSFSKTGETKTLPFLQLEMFLKKNAREYPHSRICSYSRKDKSKMEETVSMSVLMECMCVWICVCACQILPSYGERNCSYRWNNHTLEINILIVLIGIKGGFSCSV